MQTRPHNVPFDGHHHPTNSPEDNASRHVNAILYNIPEVRSVMSERKSAQSIHPVAAPINEHVDGLSKIRTQLKNMDAQITVQRLKEAHRRFQEAPTEENLSSIAREAYHLGHQLNVPDCHIACHIEELKAATHVLVNAVKKGDQDTILHQRHLIHILMKNLVSSQAGGRFEKDIQQLNQNFLIFRTLAEPSPEDVAEWHKALHEFPPIN